MTVDWQPAESFQDILYDRAIVRPGAGIARITINRPEVHNAFRPL